LEALVSAYQQYGLHLWAIVVVAVILLVVWLIVLQTRVRRLGRRYAALISAPEGKDLGELFSIYVEEMRMTASRVEQLARTSVGVEQRARSSIGRPGLVRFNAYPGIGGEQSFAVALLDDEGDGVVLSSLQGRGEGRLYAKPVSRWNSTYTLSAEEEQAIAQAHGNNVDKDSHL
jgi:hypothetical protein